MDGKFGFFLIMCLFLMITACGCISEKTADNTYAKSPDAGLKTIGGLYRFDLSNTISTPLFSDEGSVIRIFHPEDIMNLGYYVSSNFSLGLVTIPPGKGTPPHRLMNTSEMIFVTGGTALIKTPGSATEVNTGDAVLIREGTLQSVYNNKSGDLVYLTSTEPVYDPQNEVLETELPVEARNDEKDSSGGAGGIIVTDLSEGIEWDYDSGTLIYTIFNAELMADRHPDLPVDYSLAYAELIPGGRIDENTLLGASELIYVVSGSICLNSSGGIEICADEGQAVYVPSDCPKSYRNSGNKNAVILSYVDPSWKPEITVMR
ncbi:cupin domain-containing protein [Methanoplanus limicola]|uniref:Cupin 2 conserved barrel domain protein n=1 Tax=Methanoplanus limicola DSM 2279 TaxID=937775 RepID=H1YXG8_9EURY|nr:cupin domain-containing protein [Methanoplanus limicola]EHQ36905.1 Cupin 2 conserved barrel domain protein [Methanoplanus limicola DSM 2279]